MDCRTQLASMAIDEVERGDFEMAIKILTTSIRLEPNNHEHYVERSVCHHKLANYQASLDDANTAIRLKPSDYNIHYQKGLALIGLSMLEEAVKSFKKAIELRAKQDDSRLSDIFKVIKNAMYESNIARGKLGSTKTTSQAMVVANTTKTNTNTNVPSNQTPVTPQIPIADSTSNLVVTSNRNNNQKQCATNPSSSSMLNNNETNGTAIAVVATTTTPNRVSSPAGQHHLNSHNHHLSQQQQQQQQQHHHHQKNTNLGDLSSHRLAQNSIGPSGPSQINHHEPKTTLIASQPIATINTKASDQHRHHQSPTIQHPNDATKQLPAPGSYDWNIRRSERIFLHNSSEPGTSGPNDEAASQPRQRLSSNPSSVSSGKGANKRPYATDHRHSEIKAPAYHQAIKNETNSVLDSEVDVDDSSSYSNLDSSSGITRKRVMVTPSSSMPATNQNLSGPFSATSKDDSYASKYKRLRRDRERARRGTSKLCTIRPCDLDELIKMSRAGSEKRFMRVIAPIDGWLYSGQLSLDDNNNNQNGTNSVQYVVKLDGDTSGSSYLFTQETVLNDVIKEVRVKSVSELRKGARICCYWSRTYKCLSTGVVTSRTFEETKSLVSVKYDNGDLSALPLEDLRLLPPDYPKYMSNCDPLLLAKNGDTSDPMASQSKTTNRIVVDCKSSTFAPCATYSKASNNSASLRRGDQSSEVSSQPHTSLPTAQELIIDQADGISAQHKQDDMNQSFKSLPTVESMRSVLDDDTIPPTDETINFITSEGNGLDVQDQDIHQMDCEEHEEGVATKDNMMVTTETTTPLDASRASSEENNYGIEYRPWVFEGPPKRSKRNGRTYRDTYSAIRRGNEVIKVGDSAELMPRDESILPFIAKVDGLWATSRGEMRVRVRWYYRLVETEGEPYELEDGENALFETDHFDENDVQSIWRTTKILSWTDYARDHMRHVNKPSDGPKVFYLAGYYDPVRRTKHLRSDVKSIQ